MNTAIKYLLHIYLFCCVSARPMPVVEDTELILVSVIFRHGARTTYLFYPKDPNKNATFYPTDYGGLTNDGKLGEYKLGHYLKDLYGDFLGEYYTEEKVYVRSTDVTRTKMSAQLVLAGLFPPSKLQVWNQELMWQPIPVSYKSEVDEDIFHPFATCPYKVDVIERLPEIPEVQEAYIKPYASTFSYIEENSGKVMKCPQDMQELYFILETEHDLGLIMPEWTKNVFPEPGHTIASEVYGYHNHDQRVKQINSGYMLQKILDDSKEKINGTSSRQIFLYSGHESTLGYMLDALKVDQGHVPPYGSAISFEIHRRGEEFYVKIHYRNATDATQPIDLKIPGCDVLCPFDEFVELQKDLLPTITIEEACKKEQAFTDTNGI